jgi:P-type Cu+ transporter
MKTYASRLGLAGLVLSGILALAACGSAGGSMEGMDHASNKDGSKQGAEHSTTDHKAGETSGTLAPAEAGVEVDLGVDPAPPEAQQPVELAYRVTEADSGEVISEMPVDHERQMHLIAVSRDLEKFQHIHPEPSARGDFAVTTRFPTQGTYVLFDEFVRDGHKLLDRREVEVGGAGGTASLRTDLEPKTVGGLTVSLEAPEEIRAGEEASFTYTLTKEDGAPADDLGPYLGAPAHVAIVSEDTERFAHTHGEAATSSVAGSDGGGEHAGHGKGRAFGPEIGFHHTFEAPGLYKVWAQFNHHGRVVAVPFVLDVA